jgi:hypothetical protein
VAVTDGSGLATAYLVVADIDLWGFVVLAAHPHPRLAQRRRARPRLVSGCASAATLLIVRSMLA